jgi:hypothetical protein
MARLIYASNMSPDGCTEDERHFDAGGTRLVGRRES